MLSVILETFQMMASSMSVETDVHFHCDPFFDVTEDGMPFVWASVLVYIRSSWFIYLNSIFCLEIVFLNIYTIESLVLYKA